MYFPSEEYGTSIVLPYEFNAVRVFGNALNPTTFKVKIAATPHNMEQRSPARIEEKSNDGVQRLAFWWDTIMTDVIILDVESDIFVEIVGSVDNTTMFCPGQPTDHLLAELLHSKISKITSGLFDIHAISLCSKDTEYVETSFRNIGGYSLPDISYFGAEAFHATPWWTRDTIEVCEFGKGTVVAEELYNHFSDFFGKKEEADIIIFRADDTDED